MNFFINFVACKNQNITKQLSRPKFMNEQNASIKPYVIGLDLGGTNSVFGIVDARGDIKATTAIKTGGYDKAEDYVDACVEALQVIIEQVGGIETIKAMGIGAPNGNYYNGTIEFAPNLPWAHNGVVPLAKLFSERLNNIPVALTNDANAAAIGEMVYGVARGMKNFIVITLGTGVGSGIVVNGQLLYGHDGFAGELGHVTMVRGAEGRSCGCGRTGCLEAYCVSFVIWIQRRSPLSMYPSLPARAMLWHRRSMSSQERCSVRHVPISQHSAVLRHLSSSEEWLRQVS